MAELACVTTAFKTATFAWPPYALILFVNSVAGLTGQIISNGFQIDLSTLSLLAGAVFLGGQIGVRMTIFKLDPLIVKRITAILILIVSIRILSRYL